MKRNNIIQLLIINQEEIRSRFNVDSLSLFGSAARNEAGSESDLDFLVSFNSTPGLFGFLELKYYLEDLFKCQVDLVTQKALKKQLKERILQGAFHAI